MITYKEFMSDKKENRLYTCEIGYITREQVLRDLELIEEEVGDIDKQHEYLRGISYATGEEIEEYNV